MIEAEKLTKLYGPLRAVDGISFKVQPGEVLGFLGPNGAGKTTTMRMFAGFVQPTSGHAEICGHSIERQPTDAKRCIGYLPEGAPVVRRNDAKGLPAIHRHDPRDGRKHENGIGSLMSSNG